MKEYPGIDYGFGQTNIDTETGIRFGVIGQNAEHLSLDATQDLWTYGKNLSFENFQSRVKTGLKGALSDYFSSKLDDAVNQAFEAIEDDLNDGYQSESDIYLYEQDGYVIQTGETDLTVLKSPYFTRAQFCSPRAPGAGHLENPCETGPKTYCLGHDWFEDNQAPYPVYSVASGELILKQ